MTLTVGKQKYSDQNLSHCHIFIKNRTWIVLGSSSVKRLTAWAMARHNYPYDRIICENVLKTKKKIRNPEYRKHALDYGFRYFDIA